MRTVIPVLSLFFVLGLTSCGSSRDYTLYSWSNYQSAIYSYAKTGSDKDIQNLEKTYERMMEVQRGTRETIPPGICADYGYLLIKNGKTEEGISFLKKEIALYPESATFIQRIIKKLEE
jgi:hypothetical protein